MCDTTAGVLHAAGPPQLSWLLAAARGSPPLRVAPPPVSCPPTLLLQHSPGLCRSSVASLHSAAVVTPSGGCFWQSGGHRLGGWGWGGFGGLGGAPWQALTHGVWISCLTGSPASLPIACPMPGAAPAGAPPRWRHRVPSKPPPPHAAPPPSGGRIPPFPPVTGQSRGHGSLGFTGTHSCYMVAGGTARVPRGSWPRRAGAPRGARTTVEGRWGPGSAAPFVLQGREGPLPPPHQATGFGIAWYPRAGAAPAAQGHPPAPQQRVLRPARLFPGGARGTRSEKAEDEAQGPSPGPSPPPGAAPTPAAAAPPPGRRPRRPAAAPSR